MQRLVEQLADNGAVLEGTTTIGRVHYHLSVYQHFSEADEPVPADLVVEGRITPIDALDLTELHRRGSVLTLQLANGRVLEFSTGNDEGTIRSTGRGLYTE
jgi:hypothetical protein